MHTCDLLSPCFLSFRVFPINKEASSLKQQYGSNIGDRSVWTLPHCRSRPQALLDGLWQMTLQEATVHTNKIRLHGIELKQSLEEVIYRWGAACKIVLLDSITMPYCNVRGIGWPSESCHSWWCWCLLVSSRGFWRQSDFWNGSLLKIDEEPLLWIIDSLWYRLCQLNSVATPTLRAKQHTAAE